MVDNLVSRFTKIYICNNTEGILTDNIISKLNIQKNIYAQLEQLLV